MSFFDFLLGPGKTPTPQRIASQVKALQQRHGDPSFRYQAADVLAGWGTPEAIAALLGRFTVNVASETSDEEEKTYVAGLITDKIGKAAVDPIEKYLKTHEQVGWPLRMLGKLVGPKEFRERCARVLAGYDTHFDRIPERKIEMLHFLIEHAQHAEIADAAQRFLEDTDDRVRIAAIELLQHSGRPEDIQAMIACLIDSPDRPRVKSALADALDGKPGAFAGRVEEATSYLPAGCTLTPDGTLVKPVSSRRA